MSLIVRFALFVAAPIAALLVARDSLQFGMIQTFVAILLIVIVVGGFALGPRILQSLRRSSDHRTKKRPF